MCVTRVCRWCVRSLLISTALAAIACGSSSSSPAAPSAAAPAAAPAAPSLNLAGSWSGTLGKTNDSKPIQVKWSATQSAASVTGPVSLVVTNNDGNGNTTVFPVAGTMAATISGSDAAITLTLPPGAFTSIGGPSTCSVNGTGTASSATASAISAALNIVFDPSCVGTIADHASETDNLVLSK